MTGFTMIPDNFYEDEWVQMLDMAAREIFLMSLIRSDSGGCVIISEREAIHHLSGLTPEMFQDSMRFLSVGSPDEFGTIQGTWGDPRLIKLPAANKYLSIVALKLRWGSDQDGNPRVSSGDNKLKAFYESLRDNRAAKVFDQVFPGVIQLDLIELGSRDLGRKLYEKSGKAGQPDARPKAAKKKPADSQPAETPAPAPRPAPPQSATSVRPPWVAAIESLTCADVSVFTLVALQTGSKLPGDLSTDQQASYRAYCLERASILEAHDITESQVQDYLVAH